VKPPAVEQPDALVEVRVAVGLWIGPILFQAGDTTQMSVSDAEALKPRVEII
jgi:hypothetical protein